MAEKTSNGLPLYFKILIGLFAGFVVGIIATQSGHEKLILDWIAPFGKIFINLLKVIAVPLIFFSVISGISSLAGASRLGHLAYKTLILYFVTTIIAVSVGLILVNVVKPGNVISKDQQVQNRVDYEVWAKESGVPITDGKMFSEDASVQARLAGEHKTAAVPVDSASLRKLEEVKEIAAAQRANEESEGPLYMLVQMVPENLVHSFGDIKLMLQVIVFAIFFGVAMLFIPDEQTSGLRSFIDGANAVFLKMIDILMRGAPFFVFALLAGAIASAGANVQDLFKSLIGYSLTVVAGLLFMIFVFYPIVTMIFGKVSYGKFFRSMKSAQTFAFSTSSSAATLPITIDCVQNKLGVDKRITDFVLPIGATVNMDGTSLYQAVAVVFLAQSHMIELDFAQQLTIVLTATLASIGSAAVPSAGLVMLFIVMESVGLNPAWIAAIIPVDRLLDMCRTVVNVTGDASVSAIIARSEGKLKDPQITETKES